MGDPSARDFEVFTIVSLSLAGTATSIVDLSDRDNKETLFVKEEETNGAEVFGEVARTATRSGSGGVSYWEVFLWVVWEWEVRYKPPLGN